MVHILLKRKMIGVISSVENVVVHCWRGCMDGIQLSPAPPYEDWTHPTGFPASSCEHHARVGQDRRGRDSAVTTGSGSRSIHRQWFIPVGSRRQNCSIGILPSFPVATNLSITPTRCDASLVHALVQSPGLLQQHPGQCTKWLAWTASVGSQSCSASGFASSSSIASIRPHARETSLAWHQQMSNVQAVLHRTQVSTQTLSWLFVFDVRFILFDSWQSDPSIIDCFHSSGPKVIHKILRHAWFLLCMSIHLEQSSASSEKARTFSRWIQRIVEISLI